MSPLDHKLLRDLWRGKGQALAIGLVIAVGVMMLVMMSGLVTSLNETRAAYYERYRLAGVFAPVTRAPERLLSRLAAIGGVGTSDRNDEILLLQSFASAQDLHPGDRVSATMNGARRTFHIAGLAQSPEFLYTTAPGEMVPDDARFGVFWINNSSLAAAYDMQGAFNEVLLSLSRGANEPAVLAAVDRVLDPFGGTGAYPLADQTSNRFISEEISGLEAAAVGVPPIFLAVAAFLLHIVISRMVQSERADIGLMKAFGYTNAEVGSNYFKMVLAIALGGALVECLLGIATGRAMIQIYTAYFQFPLLVCQLEPSSFLIGVSVSVVSASAGGLLVLSQVL